MLPERLGGGVGDPRPSAMAAIVDARDRSAGSGEYLPLLTGDGDSAREGDVRDP